MSARRTSACSTVFSLRRAQPSSASCSFTCHGASVGVSQTFLMIQLLHQAVAAPRYAVASRYAASIPVRNMGACRPSRRTHLVLSLLASTGIRRAPRWECSNSSCRRLHATGKCNTSR